MNIGSVLDLWLVNKFCMLKSYFVIYLVMTEWYILSLQSLENTSQINPVLEYLGTTECMHIMFYLTDTLRTKKIVHTFPKLNASKQPYVTASLM